MSEWTIFHADDRGVSELVTFVLIFGIILSSVAVLSVGGFQAMDEYQEAEQLANAERAMDALTENFNDVLRTGGIEQRYSELALREGTVRADRGGTVVTVAVDGESVADDEPFDAIAENGSFELGTFAYEHGSETIAYEGGALVRNGDGNSVLVSDPLLDCRAGETAVVSIAVVDSEIQSVQSHTGFGVTISERDRYTSVDETGGGDNVTVTIEETAHESAWETAVSGGGWTADGGEDVTGVCENVDRLVVTVVEVELEY